MDFAFGQIVPFLEFFGTVFMQADFGTSWDSCGPVLE